MAGIGTTLANMFRPSQQVTINPASYDRGSPMQQANPGAAAVVPPAGTSQNPIQPEPVNPLDEISALWQNDPNLKQAVDPMSTPLFNTDSAAISAAAGKIDFLGQIPPEMLAKAMQGGDPQAFLQVMNAVAQRAVATSTQLNAATIEQATTRNNARITQALPDRMKRIQLDSMVSENPVLAHPASQPFLQMTRAQLQMKNPGMSAAEINRRAESALMGFASTLAAPTATEQAASKAATGGTDWDAWAGSDT